MADAFNPGRVWMSFRTRLTSFFVVIVALPMVAVGFLVFRLISQSEQGNADARANGLATAAASIYQSELAAARADAAAIGRNVGPFAADQLRSRAGSLLAQSGLARITLSVGSHQIVDIGDRAAIAPGAATIRASGAPTTIAVSEITASGYARELRAAGVAVVVRQHGRTLASTTPATARLTLPRQGSVTVRGAEDRTVTQRFRGFRGPLAVSVLSSVAATASSLSASRWIAIAFIAGFIALAFAFSIVASRALAGQLGRFLQAARRLASGDFSSPVPVEGNDEFAALGVEFNRMSDQLAHRIDELAEERVRLRESIRRIGETFASNLDRQALLELALKTALDAVGGASGRLTARSRGDEPLSESVRVGSLSAIAEQVLEAERSALRNGGLGEARADDRAVAAVRMRALDVSERTHGVITVARQGRAFTDDDRHLLRSLASQTTLALENVQLHHQAITDGLTDLSNHGRFQELLSLEAEQVRRYHHRLALIMLDIDGFKSINDDYGHPQGDVVLKQVARVLHDSSREVDVPARYGGDEMALILPHTDLEGAHAIAERVRLAVEDLRVPRSDGQGQLRITASVGVAASEEGDTHTLIAAADGALYTAKRQGKNRTIRARPQAANVVGAE